MCAGALLHARVARVVYAAPDPRTGAAGSVLNLFAQPALNHQTRLQGGLLAREGGALLTHFFRRRRQQQRQAHSPLRDDALRTPERRFDPLPDWPWAARYLSDLPSLRGLRLHYVDEGPSDDATAWLCLHGAGAWSYVFRHLLAALCAHGQRVVAPDLIGFGRSDKPKKACAHTLPWHLEVLRELIQRLDLRRMVLVLQAGDEALGLALAALERGRCRGVAVLAPQPHGLPEAARLAPFPDAGHAAAPRAWVRAAGWTGAASADGVRLLRLPAADPGPAGAAGQAARLVEWLHNAPLN